MALQVRQGALRGHKVKVIGTVRVQPAASKLAFRAPSGRPNGHSVVSTMHPCSVVPGARWRACRAAFPGPSAWLAVAADDAQHPPSAGPPCAVAIDPGMQRFSVTTRSDMDQLAKARSVRPRSVIRITPSAPRNPPAQVEPEFFERRHHLPPPHALVVPIDIRGRAAAQPASSTPRASGSSPAQ